MQTVRAAWRFISGNPVLSAAGHVYTLAPLAVGAGVFVWGVVKGVSPLIVAGVVLFAANVVLLAWPKVRRSHHQPSGLGPEERREQLDNLFYPPRDDRRELGERCVAFETKMRVFCEEQEAKQEKVIAGFAKEIRQADPEVDRLRARKDAESHFERNVELAYALEMRDEALRLFDEAREQGEIAAKVRRFAERPLAFEMGEVVKLFNALAHRLGREPVAYSPTIGPPPTTVASQIDAVMRDGIDLVDVLSEPATPEKTKGGWALEGGDAPDDWWEQADSYTQRARTTLVEGHPALLTDYRDAFNAYLKKESEGQSERDPAQDKRSTAEKMLDLANFERSGPMRVVEASLEGLAAARHRLGVPPA
jgi:hypothetical protein